MAGLLFYLFYSDKTSSNYLLVTARASARKKTGNQLLNPFMTLKYDSQAFNFDELDVINKPAYVIPISTLRSQMVETDRLIRKQILFTAIPFAFFHRDDWEDLSRGLTWSETEVSVGESKRLITYKCTKRQRTEAMALCLSSLASTLPVPLKGQLELFRDLFEGGVCIHTALDDNTSLHSDDIVEEEDDTDEDVNDDGMGDLDVDLINSME